MQCSSERCWYFHPHWYLGRNGAREGAGVTYILVPTVCSRKTREVSEGGAGSALQERMQIAGWVLYWKEKNVIRGFIGTNDKLDYRLIIHTYGTHVLRKRISLSLATQECNSS